MLFSLEGKVAVVTGAGSGIGQATATVLAAQGAKVALLDLDEKGANATQKHIADSGGNAEVFKVNVAKQDEVKSVFNDVANTLGHCDILVNNAGIAHIGNIENTSESDFDRVYEVNVKGAYNCLQAAITQMKQKGGGAIVNLASIASIVGIADRFAYSMSKGAILTMTLSVARDYINEGIRCNCISPGRVHTPFVDNFIAKNYPGREKEIFENLSKSQPIGRMGTPDEMAKLILYLVSDEAGFITGSNYSIDGGFCGIRM